MSEHSEKFVLFAPTVRMGGGRVLLEEVLPLLPSNSTLFLHSLMAKEYSHLLAQHRVITCESRWFERLKMEWRLRSTVESRQPSDRFRVLCFGNLPPMFLKSAKHVQIRVFFQNVLILPQAARKLFRWTQQVKFLVEEFLLRSMNDTGMIYIVQTEDVRKQLQQVLPANHILVKSFVPLRVRALSESETSVPNLSNGAVEFLAVSSMDAHKNLNGLLQAWILLAKAGIFPRLSMIIPDQREFEMRWGQELHMARTLGCQIDLRSHLAHDDVLTCLKGARALVFTSWCESLGLPLVEARMLKIPVIAPELDYVREVLDPVQTFDPTSTKSLARAIKRFLGVNDSKLDIQSGMDFIETVLKS